MLAVLHIHLWWRYFSLCKIVKNVVFMNIWIFQSRYIYLFQQQEKSKCLLVGWLIKVLSGKSDPLGSSTIKSQLPICLLRFCRPRHDLAAYWMSCCKTTEGKYSYFTLTFKPHVFGFQHILSWKPSERIRADAILYFCFNKISRLWSKCVYEYAWWESWRKS